MKSSDLSFKLCIFFFFNWSLYFSAMDCLTGHDTELEVWRACCGGRAAVHLWCRKGSLCISSSTCNRPRAASVHRGRYWPGRKPKACVSGTSWKHQTNVVTCLCLLSFCPFLLPTQMGSSLAQAALPASWAVKSCSLWRNFNGHYILNASFCLCKSPPKISCRLHILGCLFLAQTCMWISITLFPL